MTTPRAYDVIVIGGGSNGVVASAMLGKAGRRVLHLVREPHTLGMSGYIKVAPGFRALVGLEPDWIPPAVARELALPNLGVAPPEPPTSVALPDGGILSLATRTDRAAEAIRRHSPRDADRWGAFTDTVRDLAGFLEALYQVPATNLDSTSLGDLPSLLSLGRAFRGLGRANMSELLRVMPIPAQDLADDWFTFGPLKAAIGAAAVRDIRQGPRSGGTSFILLHYLTGATRGAIRGRPWPWAGGPGADAVIAMAQQLAEKHGAVVRTETEVARIVVREDSVAGVVLTTGEEISAPMVLSTEDPAKTLLGMVDPVWLDPEFLLAVRNIKFRGSTAMIYYALETLPEAPGFNEIMMELSGLVSLSTSLDAIEKACDAAKYGMVSEQPHVEISVPSLRWPLLATFTGNHVLTAKVQFAPHTLRDGAVWDTARSDALANSVTAAISRVMPRFADAVRDRLVLTPRDLEDRFGVTGGAITHGEMTLDQILFMRPVAGWGQYATPIRGLYLGGPGTHPGPGVFGASGLLAARRMLADWRKRK
jgi:phytoene dehydrogenase-like protein